MDGLLEELSESGVGCFGGHKKLCLQEHSAMQMTLLSWLHVHLLLDVCWIFVQC